MKRGEVAAAIKWLARGHRWSIVSFKCFRWRASGWGLLWIGLTLGCSNNSETHNRHSVSQLGQSKVEVPGFARTHHDFGIVRPGSRLSHRFKVKNSSDARWTLDRIVTTCRCTATDVSSQVVEPGAELVVDVRYTAPTKEGSDRKQVELYFRESGNSACQLGISAIIRQRLYLTEAELKVEPGENSAPTALVAANYGDEDWSGLRASTSVSWLSVAIFPVDDERVKTARQAWRVMITADTSKLPNADDRAVVSFTSVGPEKPESQHVVVSVIRRQAIEAIPNRLFLGRISTDQRVERSVLVRMSDASVHENGQVDINKVQVIGSNLPGTISHTVSGIRDNLVRVNLSFAAPSVSGVVDGTVSLKLGSSWPTLELPVAAMVEASR